MEKASQYPLLFEPNLRQVVWGGRRLRPFKGLEADANPIGESWEVSAVPGRESVVSNGSQAGHPLSALVKAWGADLLGHAVAKNYGEEFPLLVKYIDAEGDLSIQVHPDDAMAARVHGGRGKTEMWYVIDARPGACLYAGLAERITPEDYARHVAEGTICEVLAKHEVHAGDVFFLPAGRIHAICGGILLAEVQQSSDITYRIFDYNRPGLDGKPRELHTELAAQAIDYQVQDDYRTHYEDVSEHASRVVDSPYFSVRVTELSDVFHRDMLKYDSFVICLCLQGDCRIRLRQPVAEQPEVLLKEGWACLIPAAVADYDVIPSNPEQCSRILDAYIDNMDRSIAGRVNRFLHLGTK